ncbi:LysR family transcriptional regulator [Altererythrobacter sp. CC-YST694]|nr:LysR family transcriptional regulator [Altererythrobacter sp. CC-YST694]
MNWADLRYLLALARHGTLSGAAREVKAEHTTVSRRVAALEQALGTRLFERQAGGFILTPQGEQAVVHAQRVEEEVHALLRQVEAGAPSIEGKVRISAPPVFAACFIAPRLASLRQLHPRLEIELAGESTAINLFRRDADIAIRLSRPQESSTIARLVGKLAYGLYATPAYLANASDAEREFLAYDDSLDNVPQQKWLHSVARGRRIAFRSNDLAALHAAAAQGMGMAALPRFIGDGDERLTRIPVDAAGATRDIWLLVHPDLRRSPRIRVAFDYLAEAITASRALLDPQD